MDNIIEVRDLVVKFGDFAAVNGISFDVKEGEIFGFLGPNGAGKTTSIRTITTIQRYDSGSVTIDGHDIKTDYLEARKLIGIAQQHISLDKDLTVRQNLKHHAIMHKIPAKELDRTIEEMADILELGDFMDHKVMDLSGGWKRKAAIIGAIIHNPKILLLDEHTAALDPGTAEKVLEITRDVIRDNHLTCLMITHNMHNALELGNRTLMMNQGKIIYDVRDEERDGLTVQDLLERFRISAGEELDNDRMLLSE